MSLPITDLKPAPPQGSAAPREHEVERSAFYLESEGQSLFAWLHRPVGVAATHGVLICPPVGHEQVHAHRTLRHLANRLAAQGFAMLRIDYQGTGDSDGTHDDPHLVTRWQTNVHDAAQWLRERGGCDHLSLIGLRLGGTLAALYAEQHEVENLVLWAPIVKGKRYVRELTALSRTATLATDADSTSIEAMGFVFTDESAQDLSKLDLAVLSPRFKRALIAHSESGPKDKPLIDHLAKSGASVDSLAMSGYEEMMAEPQDTVVPHAALKGITEWMRSNEVAPSLKSHDGSKLTTSMLTSAPSALRESVHRLSRKPDLWGVIAESETASTSLPWVVMLNAGAAYRIGPGRLYVKLARQLAALGYPCLRMDISGIGDSEVDPLRVENDTYPATAFRDVALACDYLTKLQPQRRIILMGLCSGAYAAFQSAAQLPHPALVESIMLNPLTFFWKEGMTLDDAPTQRLQAWHYYKSIMFDLKSWRRLLSGKTNMGFSGALRRFAQVVLPRNDSAATSAEEPSEPSHQSDYSHPPKEDLSADLSRAVAASRHLTMVVSEGDPGHFLLMYKARRKASQLIRAGHLQCHFINNANHTFSTESARESLSRVLTEHLGSRYGLITK